MALTVLCTALAVQVMPVAAEGTDANLRAWFDFNQEHFLGRDHVIFDVMTHETDASGDTVVKGVYGNDVEVVKGLNGDALKFDGTVANIDTIASLQCQSAFYVQSSADLFAGDNVTINIVYKEDTTEQIQSILYAGLNPVEFMAVSSSFSTKSVGAQLAINDSGAFDEKKLSAPASTIPAAGTWNMLTIVQEGTVYNIYVNGELVATDNMTWKLGDINTSNGAQHLYALGAPSPYNDLSEWMLGAPADAPGFKGLIDDFRVYGAALSQTEIEALALELNVIASPVDAYAENMFGLVVRDSYDDVGGVAVPDDPGDNTNGIGNVHNNAWVSIPKVTFGDAGAKSITLKYCAKESRMGANGKATIWMDGKSAAEGGTKIGEVALPITGPEYSNFDIVSANLLNTVTGTHDVYFVFTADTTTDKPYVANMSYFKFGADAIADDNNDDNNNDDNNDNNNDVEASNTQLGATDKEVLFYTDFSNVSGLVVKEAGKANADAPTVEPQFDAEGNLILTRDQYVDLGIGLLDGQDAIIIEFVVKPTEIIEHAAFAGIGVGDDAGWVVMGMRGDGAVKFGSKSNDIEVGALDAGRSEGGLLVANEWVNVKYEITATTAKVFVNGVEVKSWDLNGQLTLAEIAELEGAQFAFGKETKWGDAGFVGAVSEIRVTTTTVEDTPDDSVQTGDVASVAALLLAGVAALGGLTLRKRSK